MHCPHGHINRADSWQSAGNRCSYPGCDYAGDPTSASILPAPEARDDDPFPLDQFGIQTLLPPDDAPAPAATPGVDLAPPPTSEPLEIRVLPPTSHTPLQAATPDVTPTLPPESLDIRVLSPQNAASLQTAAPETISASSSSSELLDIRVLPASNTGLQQAVTPESPSPSKRSLLWTTLIDVIIIVAAVLILTEWVHLDDMVAESTRFYLSVSASVAEAMGIAVVMLASALLVLLFTLVRVFWPRR